MQTIRKYELHDSFKVVAFTTISMPKDAHILKADSIRNICCVYALVDTEQKENVMRNFLLFPTGGDFSAIKGAAEYINTVQLNNGTLILHIFELTTTNNDEENTGLFEETEQTAADND